MLCASSHTTPWHNFRTMRNRNHRTELQKLTKPGFRSGMDCGAFNTCWRELWTAHFCLGHRTGCARQAAHKPGGTPTAMLYNPPNTNVQSHCLSGSEVTSHLVESDVESTATPRALLDWEGPTAAWPCHCCNRVNDEKAKKCRTCGRSAAYGMFP